MIWVILFFNFLLIGVVLALFGMIIKKLHVEVGTLERKVDNLKELVGELPEQSLHHLMSSLLFDPRLKRDSLKEIHCMKK